MAICKHCGQEMPDNLGTRVASFRETIGYTQAEFARMIGISQPNLSRIEKGSRYPSIGQLMSIASNLGVTPNDLLIGDK